MEITPGLLKEFEADLEKEAKCHGCGLKAHWLLVAKQGMCIVAQQVCHICLQIPIECDDSVYIPKR